MKYSIIMPYYNRAEQFHIALNTYRIHYGNRDDYEIILIEEGKNQMDRELHSSLVDVLAKNSDLNIKHFTYEQSSYNPAGMFNMGVSVARGEYIILSNPEIAHETPILNMFDRVLAEDDSKYYVSLCKAVTIANPERWRMLEWYIHPSFNNRYLHFCSVLKKDTYEKIGGFDEAYLEGIAFEDDDFVRTIEANKIEMVHVMDAICMHIHHDRNYTLPMSLWQAKFKLNEKIYKEKWNL